MEELFTTETEPASREALVRLLATLAGSGFVWVIGTIRADFFHRCGEVPGLLRAEGRPGSYELLPPTGPEIAQIIREPARAAGLRFEEAADQGRLEDVLQEAAVADPGSLPLLEFVLDALYEAGRERRLLTFAAYRALGGLEGAIARRADEVVDALRRHIQEALAGGAARPDHGALGDEAVTRACLARRRCRNAGAIGSRRRADRGPASRQRRKCRGHAIVRVAHEALLSRWPRARDIVNANRDFLETRARVQDGRSPMAFGQQNPDLLLPQGKRLAEGEELLLSRREEVDDQIVEYIEASSLAEKAAAEKERASRARAHRGRGGGKAATRLSARQSDWNARPTPQPRSLAATRLARRTRFAAVVAIILAAIAGAGAFVGFSGQHEAERQAALAEENAN